MTSRGQERYRSVILMGTPLSRIEKIGTSSQDIAKEMELQVGMIFSSPVPKKACTESPKGSRCMLFAGQMMKISYPSVVQREINLAYDMITVLAEKRQK